jgi:hypothetical protein
VTHVLRRAARVLLASLAMFGVVAGATLTTAAPAAAAVTTGYGYDLPAGPHLRAAGIGHEWMGSFTYAGGLRYCIDYTLPLPAEGGVLQGPTRDPRIAYLMRNYSAVRNNDQGAAVNAVLNKLIGNPKFRADWATTYLPALQRSHPNVLRIVADLEVKINRYAGPYRVVVQTTATAPIGERARFAVKVISTRNNGGIPNVPLSYANSVGLRGVVLPVRTNAAGAAAVEAIVLAPSVLLRVTATVSPWASVIFTRSGAGHQRLISGSADVRVAGTAAFRTTFRNVAPVVHMNCTWPCAGRPPMELGGTVPRGGTHVRFTAVDSVTGRDVASVDITPGFSAKTSFVGEDGHDLRIYREDLVNGAWTPRRLVSTFAVVCPPGAFIEVQLAIACDGAVTGSVTDVNDTRYEHRMAVILPNGTRVPWTIAPHTRGTSPALSWRNGVIAVQNTSWFAGAQVGGVEPVASIGVATPVATARVHVTRVKACAGR